MPKQFVMIMTDSQRLDLVSCYEDAGVKTPCIDALAAEGVLFSKAYTVQPVCGPARAALFTGQYPCVNGAFANCNAPALNVRSIGERLTDKGIHTGYIGKWHLDGGDYFGLGVCPPGWEAAYWYDMRNYLDELNEGDKVKSRTYKAMEGEGITAEFTFAHRCADRAVAFMEAHKNDDFFLVVSFDEPHDPSLCPEPYASMYKDFSLPKRPNVYDTLEGKPEHQKVWAGPRLKEDRDKVALKAPTYYGCNTFVDSQIGRVTEAAALLADAKVLYTSDHGDMTESHCLYAKGPAAYEEITHIPFIMKGFGKGRIDTPVSHIDVCATVWDFFGFEKPMMLQGDSLLPLLKANEKPTRRDIFIEFGRYETDHDGFGGFQPMRCVYDGQYKLVINLLSSDELYDLADDPYEMTNRIEDDALAEVRRALLMRLLDHMNDIRDPFRGYHWENRPWNKAPVNPPSWDYTGYTRQREEPDYEKPQLDYSTGLVPKKLSRWK